MKFKEYLKQFEDKRWRVPSPNKWYHFPDLDFFIVYEDSACEWVCFIEGKFISPDVVFDIETGKVLLPSGEDLQKETRIGYMNHLKVVQNLNKVFKRYRDDQ